MFSTIILRPQKDSISKQGLGIFAPKLNKFMDEYLAQGALSGVMHGIGAYDKARGKIMATRDTVMGQEPSRR